MPYTVRGPENTSSRPHELGGETGDTQGNKLVDTSGKNKHSEENEVGDKYRVPGGVCSIVWPERP